MKDINGDPLLILTREDAQVLSFVLALCTLDTTEIRVVDRKITRFLEAEEADEQKFTEHLEEAFRTVSTWAKWKRNVLGDNTSDETRKP